eukprot:9005498-Pyramimonas_sp.AAC.1
MSLEHGISSSSVDGERLVLKMRFSWERHAHSAYHVARASRMEGGSFPICGSRLSATHMCLNSLQQSHVFLRFTSQNWCPGKASECQGATVTLLMCGADVPQRAFSHDLGSSGLNSTRGSRR